MFLLWTDFTVIRDVQDFRYRHVTFSKGKFLDRVSREYLKTSPSVSNTVHKSWPKPQCEREKKGMGWGGRLKGRERKSNGRGKGGGGGGERERERERGGGGAEGTDGYEVRNDHFWKSSLLTTQSLTLNLVTHTHTHVAAARMDKQLSASHGLAYRQSIGCSDAISVNICLGNLLNSDVCDVHVVILRVSLMWSSRCLLRIGFPWTLGDVKLRLK